MLRFGPARHVLAVALLLSSPALAQPGWTRIGAAGFDTKTKDLSGIACRPEAAGRQACLLVNDESRFAQFATLSAGRLEAGRKVDLIGRLGAGILDTRPPRIVGSEAAGRPVNAGRCEDRPLAEDFGEFDGEGVAWAASAGGGGAFYVVGAHACGRNDPRRRRSTHLLARIPVDTAGKAVDGVQLTWRLGEVLRGTPETAAQYGLPLDPVRQGIDIEGIASLGDTLVFGLRAPSLDGKALMLLVRADELFSPGGPPPAARAVRVPVGAAAGIRDLAALPDGRLLILTGAAQGQTDVPQTLLITTPGAGTEWAARPVGPPIVPPRPAAKAEGLAVLAADRTTATVLLLFEAIEKDKPVRAVIRLP